ncbi:DUF397 domain-containing protein [Streptomyces sp. 142MFCol3.1]|uniref:DUF397 domain-containing protein n=1 Tax=Streptomyces sp. 142MFCol3.1 TaxID=1172179 RepID=UPI0004087D4B|nr:DUF397 domain-containing protein [Streptomyces sp. 142MFCol3.1]
MIHGTSVESASELKWFKSSYSSSSEAGDCVEIAPTPTTIHVRDSKDPQGPRLALAPTAWADFVTFASGN